MAPAMPCKTCKKSKHGVTSGKSNEIKSKLACILEASKSTRMRMKESLLQERVRIHYNITIWCPNLFLCLEAMKIPAAKAAVDKEWEKLENCSAWNLTRV